jgi:hypothetical protein
VYGLFKVRQGSLGQPPTHPGWLSRDLEMRYPDSCRTSQNYDSSCILPVLTISRAALGCQANMDVGFGNYSQHFMCDRTAAVPLGMVNALLGGRPYKYQRAIPMVKISWRPSRALPAAGTGVILPQERLVIVGGNGYGEACPPAFNGRPNFVDRRDNQSQLGITRPTVS